MRIIIFLLISFAFLWSGVLGTTTSVLMQSMPLVLLSICCILTSIHSYYSKDRLFSETAIKPLIFTVLSATYFLIRALLSDVIDLGIGDSFLILSGLLLYTLSCYWGRESLYYKLIIGVVILLTILNLLNFIPFFQEFRDDLIPFSKGNEVSGLYNHRNFLSNFLMMNVLLFISVFICYKNNKVFKIFCLLLALIGIFAIYAIKARGAYIGLITGVSVISLFIYDYYLKNKKTGLFIKIGKISVLLFVLGLVGKFGNDIYHERSTSKVKATDLGDRLEYFAMAIDQIPDAFIFGSGSMSYSYKYYLNWGDLGHHHLDHVWVHNEFIQVMTDYGLVGLIFILILLMVHIWNAIKYSLIGVGAKSSNDSNNRVNFLRVAGLSMIIGSAFNMLVSFPAHSYSNIMLMALACSWMAFRDSENASGSEAKAYNNKYIAKYASIAMFFILGSVTLTLALPQLKAAMIFSEYGIYEDNANWSTKKSLDSEWLPALKKVVVVAPTHIRHERLSSLYLERAATKNKLNTQDAQDDIKKALEHSGKALERHPYDAVSIANHASSLFQLKQYKEAEKWYELLHRYTASRQKYFQSFVKRAHNLCFLAEEYSKAGLIEEARSAYATAFECCLNSSYNNDRYSRYVIAYLLGSRTDFLIANKFDSELDKMFLEFKGEISRHNILIAYRSQVFTLVRAFIQYADLKFSKRNPELAMKWYIKASKIINKSIPNKEGVTTEVINTTKDYLRRKIKFLTDARITPAQ